MKCYYKLYKTTGRWIIGVYIMKFISDQNWNGTQSKYLLYCNIFTPVLSLQASPKLRNQFEIKFEQVRYGLIMQHLNEIPILYLYFIDSLWVK